MRWKHDRLLFCCAWWIIGSRWKWYKSSLRTGENSEKIYILREFECELLQMIRHTKDYEHLLESVKNKYQGDTIQEDLNEFLISLAEAGIIEMIKNK